MDMEKRFIGQTISYLIARDILLALLVLGHTLVYFNFFSKVNTVIVPVLCVGVLLWILFFTRLLITVSAVKKDKYIVSAFSDEYFKNAKVKAGYNGYISMFAGCMIFILGSILQNTFSIGFDIPIFIACEIILLLGVITDDISKILLSRG